LGGAYFLAKFQAGGAYSGGAYKKKRVYDYLSGFQVLISIAQLCDYDTSYLYIYLPTGSLQGCFL